MIKITQVRESKNNTAQSTLTLDALVERIRREVKTCPVSVFRNQLRYTLPGNHCEAADKLPKIMPAAQFRRSDGGGWQMKAYNGLVELTVGPLAGRTEVEQVKREAWKLPQTRCAFMGSGGHSVKILTAFTRPDNTLPRTREEAEMFHAHAYRMAVKCYQPQLSFDILPKEPLLEQYSRLSFDPEVLYRPDSVQFYLSQPLSMPGEMLCHGVAQPGKSALERAVPGFETAYAVSMLFEASLRKSYADLGGVGSPGEEPPYDWTTLLSQLALNCFTSGIPEEEVVRRVRFRYFARKPLELVRNVIRNVYGERQGFGSKSALSREQQLALQTDEFMKRRYEFRFNMQTGEAEFRERNSFCFRFLPVDKRALNSIALDAQSEGIPLWDRDISRYVYSNRVPVFNPLEDFLFNLPPWDGHDRIRPFARTVPCGNRHWPELFHRWFLNMVAHWRGMDKNYANSVSPLLVGAQGTRKSTFCRSIIPPSERSYYTDSIDFSRKKDAELYLNRFALINIDEFDQVSVTQQGFLKHILQKPVINIRKPYGTAMTEMRRYASFIATANHKDLLADPSGSRRFICVEVTDMIDTSRPIDYEQLYAQAMHELEHGERYWFNGEDEYVMAEANREFQQVSPEEQLLFRYFRPSETEQEGEWLAPAEIMETLHRQADISLTDKRLTAFGRILRKQGIPSRHTRKGTEYHVVRLSVSEKG